MLYFATYFDKNYLSRGLVLIDSLNAQEINYRLYVLCLDEVTHNYFKEQAAKYPSVFPLTLAELEAADPELQASKATRSTIEYYFTISPCLPLFLLRKFELPHICTLDADILFLASPQVLFDQLDSYSVVITPHKFSPQMQFLEKFGRYNVSFQIFRHDETGIRCLQHWREQCLAWCGDHFDEANSRYADQKYLDAWPALFPGKVRELYDPVSGVAPWNLGQYRLTVEDGHYLSNGEPLIFYHFHHFKLFSAHWAGNGLRNYAVQPDSITGRLYLDYWNRLLAYNRLLDSGRDTSVRIDLSARKRVQLLRERSVYLRLSATRILEINMDKIPNIVKQLLLKLYA